MVAGRVPSFQALAIFPPHPRVCSLPQKTTGICINPREIKLFLRSITKKKKKTLAEVGSNLLECFGEGKEVEPKCGLSQNICPVVLVTV